MYNDLCAGIYGNYDSATAQPLEVGRDQGHVQSSLSWTANAAKVIQNQGSSDLFGYNDNLLLRATEYTAKFNLNYTVEYNSKLYRCEAVLVDGPWPVISTANKGFTVPVWDILYYEYVVKRGLSAPYTTEARAQYGFEGSLPNNDGYTSWGDLIWATSSQTQTVR
jgi:hypothetical protein